MSLQDDSQAKSDTVLRDRFAAHLLNISNDINGEDPGGDHHYFRKIIINSCKVDDVTRNRVADAFLATAISQNALTMPVINDRSDPTKPVQTQPIDSEIENAVNGYMANFPYLYDTFITIVNK